MVRDSFASFFASIIALSQKPSKAAVKADTSMLNTTNLSVKDMMSLLSKLYLYEVQFLGGMAVGITGMGPKPMTKEVKIIVVEAFAVLLKKLGVVFIEENYSAISKTLLEFAAHPKHQITKHDTLLVREMVGYLLREVIGKVLSETGQLLAIKELAGWLKLWPGSSKETAPHDIVLCCVLGEISALLYELGPAAYNAQEEIVNPLLKLAIHPSISVKISIASCLRALSLALPQNLNKLIGFLIGGIQKDASSLSISTSERFVGFSIQVCALIRTIPLRSLFASYDDAAQIFSLSTQMFRSHYNSKDFRIMTHQAQVAWTLIGSLMSLGHNFVKVHISQLLLSWKDVFPKSQPRDAITTRSDAEWMYLFSSREAALSALYSFLIFNSKELVTQDVAKRIVVCLNNLLQFLNIVNGAYLGISEQCAPTAIQNKLYEKECLLKKRLFQCFKAISPPQVFEGIYTPLTRACIDTFAPDPEKPDRFLFVNKDGTMAIDGIVSTSLVNDLEFYVAYESGAEERFISRLISSDLDVRGLERFITEKNFRNFENDIHYLYLGFTGLHEYDDDPHKKTASVNDMPVPPQTGVVDSAIELFSFVFSSLTAQTQETVMEQLIKAATFSAGRINPVKKAACQLNSLVAVIGILKYEMIRRGQLGSSKVYVAMRDIAKPFLKSSDAVLRSAACEIIGRVTRINGINLKLMKGSATFLNPIIEMLVEQIQNNRDPESRAGACLALGSTLSYVGGMAAGSHIKTVVQVLHSLACDPHPLVHTWALQALYLTIESAGLMFEPYVNSTLSLIVKLYMSESHEISAPQANISTFF